jgi:3-isopropylmalate dehydrogenase
MLLKLTVLPGDGIGPEVCEAAVGVLEAVGKAFQHELQINTRNIGGAALLSNNDPLPNDTLQTCLGGRAVLLGAVGGPAFDQYPSHLRPERGLLRLRHQLGAFANLRPAVCFPGMEEASPLREEIIRGTDMLIVRELLGGLYFGEPRIIQGANGHRTATDTMHYREEEIVRVAHVSFELARARRKKVTSIDKANVLDCSRLWREVVAGIATQYPDVSLSHMYVDSAAMALVAHPAAFDVILTENMFGDILSDQAGGLIGSLGMLASASVGGPIGLYEPVHGSAPDIAGSDVANPLGAILSVALMLRYSFQLPREAGCVESAVQQVLAEGCRTSDIARSQEKALGTSAMAAKVTEAILQQVPSSASSAG